MSRNLIWSRMSAISGKKNSDCGLFIFLKLRYSKADTGLLKGVPEPDYRILGGPAWASRTLNQVATGQLPNATDMADISFTFSIKITNLSSVKHERKNIYESHLYQLINLCQQFF